MSIEPIFTTASASAAIALFAALMLTASASAADPATKAAPQPAWEEQLQNGMEIGQETDRRLKLVGYEYLGRIGSAQEAQELVDEIFADESYTVYTDIYADGHRDYDFQTWGSLRKDYEYCGMAVRDQIRHVIATQPTDVIRLTWSHNGNTYTTKALASPDEGIIYDNVATYAVQDVYIVDEESTNSGERGFKKEVRSVNVIDLPLWEADLAARSTFDTEGILRDRRSHCDIYNSKGWECSAAVYFNLDKCKINESKYNEILWEYGGTDNRGAQYVTTSDGYPMGSSRASGSVVHGRE